MVNFGAAMEYVQKIRAFKTFGTDLFLMRVNNVSVDNIIFKLHSIITVYILLCGTIFVTMKHFGEPIECLMQTTDVTKKLLEHYCWIESTYSVFSENDSREYSTYTGVQNSAHGRVVHHKYYQWIFFVLVIQAMMFYVPKYMWKAKEDKRISKLIAELRLKHIEQHGDYERNRVLQDLADTLLCGFDYFRFFVFCEFFYIVHLAFQIWLTNIILGGSFYRLGTNWLNYVQNSNDTRDPLVAVFPRLTKCIFRKFGITGEVVPTDALCFLPINIVNEKLYLILWFWFLILAVITVVYLCYHMLLIVCRPFRYRRMLAIAPNTNRKQLRRLTSNVGNWFILQFVAANMKPSHFRDLIHLLMCEHYDSNGKPHYLQKPFLKAINNFEKAPLINQKCDNSGGKTNEKKKRNQKKSVDISSVKIEQSINVSNTVEEWGNDTNGDKYNNYSQDNTWANNDNTTTDWSAPENTATEWPGPEETTECQPTAPVEQPQPYEDEPWE